MGTYAAVQSIKMQGIFGDLQVIQRGQKGHCKQGVGKAAAGKQASAYSQGWHMACSDGPFALMIMGPLKDSKQGNDIIIYILGRSSWKQD